MRLDRSVLESLGTDFERIVVQDLRIRYPESKILHNLSFYSAFLGKETQNDILFIHSKAIISVECKNWTRYIKGSYNDETWTGSSRSHLTLSVFNPITQNDIHIRALRNNLRRQGINPPVFYNLVLLPDGTQLYTDCKEVINYSRLFYVIDEIVHDSKLDIDVKFFENNIRKVCK